MAYLEVPTPFFGKIDRLTTVCAIRLFLTANHIARFSPLWFIPNLFFSSPSNTLNALLCFGCCSSFLSFYLSQHYSLFREWSLCKMCPKYELSHLCLEWEFWIGWCDDSLIWLSVAFLSVFSNTKFKSINILPILLLQSHNLCFHKVCLQKSDLCRFRHMMAFEDLFQRLQAALPSASWQCISWLLVSLLLMVDPKKQKQFNTSIFSFSVLKLVVLLLVFDKSLTYHKCNGREIPAGTIVAFDNLMGGSFLSANFNREKYPTPFTLWQMNVGSLKGL